MAHTLFLLAVISVGTQQISDSTSLRARQLYSDIIDGVTELCYLLYPPWILNLSLKANRTRNVVEYFQITKLMHNSFILQQYVFYITILNMFRAAPCSSSGGQIVLLQPLVSSPCVNSRTVCRLRAD